MKKITALLLCVLLAVSFAACGQKADTNELGTITTGKLLVGTNAEYPPYESKDASTGELVGFDVDMMKAIGEQLGVEVEFVEVGWDGIFMGLDAAKYDVVCSGVSITQARLDEKQMQFTDAYANNGQYVIIPKGTTDITKPEELAGKKVGVQFTTTADTSCQKYIEKGVNFELTSYDSIEQTFLALEAGQVDYIVTDAGVAMAYVAQNADKFEISKVKLTNEPMAISAKYGNDALTNAINGALKTLKENGKLAELSVKYMGADLTADIDMVLVSGE